MGRRALGVWCPSSYPVGQFRRDLRSGGERDESVERNKKQGLDLNLYQQNEAGGCFADWVGWPPSGR